MKWIMFFLLPTFSWATCVQFAKNIVDSKPQTCKSLDFKSMQPVEPQIPGMEDDLCHLANRRGMYDVVFELNLMFTAKRTEALKANDAKKLLGIEKEYTLKETPLNDIIEELVEVVGNPCEDRPVCLSENTSFETTRAERILVKKVGILTAFKANTYTNCGATEGKTHTELEAFCFKESKHWARKVSLDKLPVSAIINVTNKWQVGTTILALNKIDPEVCKSRL